MKVYLDNNAATQVEEKVFEAMKSLFLDNYGNPSCLHEMGKRAKYEIDRARKYVAEVIGAKDNEIVFTSGGTESNNLALKGVALANKGKNHIITTRIEHQSILDTCQFLNKTCSYKVTYLPVDRYGLVDPNTVESEIKPETILVSIMTVNSEIGTIQPIGEISNRVAKHKGVLFHTDAIGAIGLLPVDVNNWKVDFISLNGHKIHGPKGIGALYIKESKQHHIKPIIHGGSQEFGFRGGTENVPGIIGMGKACEIIHMMNQGDRKDVIETITRLRDKLIDGILRIGDVRLNGPWDMERDKRVPNNINVTFKGIENGIQLVEALNQEEIYVSTGCACNSNISYSKVLKACGFSKRDSNCTIRFTLSNRTNDQEIDYVLTILPQIVNKLRTKTTPN
jgi:cysteine desulfurase